MTAPSSGETTVPVGDWTTGTLKIYHDEKLHALQELMEQRFTDMDKAIVKAENATEERFKSVNEFRATLSDQTSSLIPRSEADQRFNALSEKITELTDRINRTEGAKTGGDLTMGKIYAAIGAAGAILAMIVLLANGVFK